VRAWDVLEKHGLVPDGSHPSDALVQAVARMAEQHGAMDEASLLAGICHALRGQVKALDCAHRELLTNGPAPLIIVRGKGDADDGGAL
jgi:hypothetical protein